MTGGILAAAVGCFSWGMVSVLFSPCHMASIPLIIGYMGGQNTILNEREAVPYAFSFIAPILAIITIQKQIATGLFLLTLFALGHCLPIAVAGSSATTVKRILNNSSFHHSGTWFRKGAGVLTGSLGIYFILYPRIVV